MNTLREIGGFVGLSPGTSMRAVGNIVPSLSSSERTSMSAMILGLQNLPPISLEAEPVGDRFGEVPFAPVFRVHPSNGVILETRITLFKNGPEPGQSEKVGESGDFSPVTLNFVGIFLVNVTRIGITNTGIISLSKSFHVEGTPNPVQPPHPPKEPTISATTEGAGAGTVLIVIGTGFLSNKIVTVRVVDDVFHERNFQQSSTTAGGLRMRISLPCNSGLPFHVSATDSRPAPGILGVLFSNNVTLPCP